MDSRTKKMKRRTFLTGVAGTAAAGLAANLVRDWHEGFLRSAVMIAGAAVVRAPTWSRSSARG